MIVDKAAGFQDAQSLLERMKSESRRCTVGCLEAPASDSAPTHPLQRKLSRQCRDTGNRRIYEDRTA